MQGQGKKREGLKERRRQEWRKRREDRKINREEKRLVEFVEGMGWGIFNENIRGDKEGEYTFTGERGNTVIDYIIGDWNVKERIVRMNVEEKVDLDHQPVMAWIKEKIKKRKRKGGTGERRGIQDDKRCKRFRQILERVKLGKKRIGEEWKEMKKKVREAIRGTDRELIKEEEKGEEW